MAKGVAGRAGPLLALMMILAGAAPTFAQDSAESRIRRLEAEVRAIKRQLSPNGERTVAPQETPADNTIVPGTPASTPLSDLLTRVDALEQQIARLTSLDEEAGNRLRQLEARVAANEAALRPPPVDPAADPSAPTAPSASSSTMNEGTANSSNLNAMTGNAPAKIVPAAAGIPPAGSSADAPAPRSLVRSAPGKAATPSAQRLAAVRAIARPQTNDAAEDEYSYGFRLWEAKFYPEAQQQLKLFISKYPRHPRVSYARNLMGRTLLDEGNPYEAAKWFVENYQANRRGDRAPDSLVLLAEAMSRLKDTSRACIALNEFAQTYPAEAAGRLRGQYQATRAAVTCN
jgi:TolA-binding protein